jgi:hypothetical protein
VDSTKNNDDEVGDEMEVVEDLEEILLDQVPTAAG